MRRLKGATVALLEARGSSELANLVRRYGGEPRPAPAMRDAPRHAPREVERFLQRLCAGDFSIAIFLSGAGATVLLQEAGARGRLDAALGALRRMTIACRGPKPVAALRRRGVATQISARAPFTSDTLLDALQAVDMSVASVGLVQYGERNAAVADALRARGAHLEELCLYEWQLPETLEPLQRLVREVIEGRIDVVAFTSTVQCRHLFQVAAAEGRDRELAAALNERTTVAAIGPVCRAALREHGVVCHVMPAAPKMAPMIAAIAEYFDLTNVNPNL